MVDYVRSITGKPVGFKSVVGTIEFFESPFEAVNKRGTESANSEIYECRYVKNLELTII